MHCDPQHEEPGAPAAATPVLHAVELMGCWSARSCVVPWALFELNGRDCGLADGSLVVENDLEQPLTETLRL